MHSTRNREGDGVGGSERRGERPVARRRNGSAAVAVSLRLVTRDCSQEDGAVPANMHTSYHTRTGKRP